MANYPLSEDKPRKPLCTLTPTLCVNLSLLNGDGSDVILPYCETLES